LVNCFTNRLTENTVIIKPLIKASFETWLSHQDSYLQNWVKANRFLADSNTICLIPNQEGQLSHVLIGMAGVDDFWVFGDLATRLPEGQYKIEPDEAIWLQAEQWQRAAIAWGLGSYYFSRYQNKNRRPETGPKQLFLPAEIDPNLCQDFVNNIYWVRDLINTPTEDMGPEILTEEAQRLAKEFNCTIQTIIGDDLLTANYPAIHAVGRASPRLPRLVDCQWGDKSAPLLTLVGKGICFDSGGLNLKSPEGMRIMKKDMGGAAHVLGLARLIMSQNLPVRLRVLLPIAENVVSGDSYRPGDIIRTRSGLSVEISNTDAEGRVVLCDALTAAASESPDLILDFSTLTGAARVAVGPDIAAFFANQEDLAMNLINAGEQSRDPLWRLPLHSAYERYLKSDFADICNASAGPYAGAITAALYLKQFVPDAIPWAHFDISAWNFDRLPGRPVGGEANGLRAVYTYLKNRYGKI